MPSSASVGNRKELDSFLHDIQAELSSGLQLSFYGNMDGPRPPSDNRHKDQPPRSDAPNAHSVPGEESNTANMAPPYFPPETYNYLIHALLSLQGSVSHSYPQNHAGTYPYPTQLGPFPLYNYEWFPGTTQPILSDPVSVAGPSQLTSSFPATRDSEQMDEAISIADDKRRRNTAASARFRDKKRNKTLDLERTVADLTGRTEGLEREAADLRRENAWLKDIVLLKGRTRNLADFNLGSQAGAANRYREEEASCNRAGDSDSESESEKKGKEKES